MVLTYRGSIARKKPAILGRHDFPARRHFGHIEFTNNKLSADRVPAMVSYFKREQKLHKYVDDKINCRIKCLKIYIIYPFIGYKRCIYLQVNCCYTGENSNTNCQLGISKFFPLSIRMNGSELRVCMRKNLSK